jgi:hypothetical protein
MVGARRTVMLSLFATLAFSVVSVSAASAALPEFLGTFANPFTAHSEAITIENADGVHATCKSGAVEGEFANAKKAKKIKMTFEGCTDSIIAGSCETNATEAGKIKTSELEGLLGYVEEAGKKVGLDLDPVAQPFAKFECSGIPVEVKGGVIGELTPINTKTKLYKLVFQQMGGTQKWTKLVGGTNSTLEVKINGGAGEKAGMAATDEIKAEKEMEIKA